jgi:hypothetical protein
MVRERILESNILCRIDVAGALAGAADRCKGREKRRDGKSKGGREI